MDEKRNKKEIKKIENKSDVKHRDTLGCLDQYMHQIVNTGDRCPLPPVNEVCVPWNKSDPPPPKKKKKKNNDNKKNTVACPHTENELSDFGEDKLFSESIAGCRSWSSHLLRWLNFISKVKVNQPTKI